MSRIRLNIDRLVLNGFQPLEAKALTDALRSQLSLVLADPRTRHEWAHSHRTPVLKLGRMPLQAGTAGAIGFGRWMAKTVAKGLKP
ncbi:MAG: hypothetical protein CV088_02665 [Nitrospira sp. LK70]|nr:hypothetical protein [Nitrospira sp. LK70]